MTSSSPGIPFCNKKTLDRDQKKWEAVKEARSATGKKGGRPPKAKKAIGFDEKQKEAKKAIGFNEKQSEANKAVSVNSNATVNDNEIVEEKLYDIDILYKKYLANDTLIQAAKQKMEFHEGSTLENRLLEFNMYLKAIDQGKKTWKDYTSHFMYWQKKTRKPKSLSAAPTFQSPVI